MSKKRVVVSLGHDALGYTTTEQWDAVKVTAKALADLVEADYQLTITHSNGPQVSMIHKAMTELRRVYQNTYAGQGAERTRRRAAAGIPRRIRTNRGAAGHFRCGCPYRQHRQKHHPHQLPQVSCNAGEAEKSHLAGQRPICIKTD